MLYSGCRLNIFKVTFLGIGWYFCTNNATIIMKHSLKTKDILKNVLLYIPWIWNNFIWWRSNPFGCYILCHCTSCFIVFFLYINISNIYNQILNVQFQSVDEFRANNKTYLVILQMNQNTNSLYLKHLSFAKQSLSRPLDIFNGGHYSWSISNLLYIKLIEKKKLNT